VAQQELEDGEWCHSTWRAGLPSLLSSIAAADELWENPHERHPTEGPPESPVREKAAPLSPPPPPPPPDGNVWGTVQPDLYRTSATTAAAASTYAPGRWSMASRLCVL